MFCQFQFGGLYLLDYFCMELQQISKEQNLKLHLISDIFICTFACLTGGIVNVPLCTLFYILMSYFSLCYQLLALQMMTVLRKNSVVETHSWQILIKKKKIAAENLLEISYHGAIIVKVTSICLTSIIYLCKIPFLCKILYQSLCVCVCVCVCIDESNGGDLYQTCRTRSMERARQIGYNFRMVM